MQATMCVVEGYSNHVMNAVGKELLPTYETIARSSSCGSGSGRPPSRSSPADGALGQAGADTGWARRFVNAVATERGHATARRIWEGPEFRPTMERSASRSGG
jgi:uncharacterized protein (DUF2342 family)